MKQSLAGYEQYMLAASDGRYKDATRFLVEALRDAKSKKARPVVAGMAQRLGDLLFKQGDRDASLALYEISEELDEGSLLSKLDFAKFLVNDLRDVDLAAQKCREIIDSAVAEPFPESDDDFSSPDYIAAAKRLLSQIGIRE